MLTKHETTKLFYNKYLYRLGLYNPIASIFRSKNFAYASTILDKLQANYEEGLPLEVTYVMRKQPIRIPDFLDAQVLYNELSRYQEEYLIRIENNHLVVFSNDKKWLKRLSYKIKNVVDFTEPQEEFANFLLHNTNTIIVDEFFGYDFKITLGGKICPNTFAQWLTNNRDKVKVTDALINEISKKQYVAGRYFYVRSENILMLVRLIIHDCIQRVDKLISKQNIDK